MRESRWVVAVAMAVTLVVVPDTPAAVRDGAARFEVITPSLVRLEYAADGRFEDRPTLTTHARRPTSPRFATSVRGGERVIRTSRMTLRWRRDAEGFGAGSLELRVGGRTLRPRPGANPAPLGGWRRSLDLVDGPVPLHEGVLSRAGWYLLDDTASALLTPTGFASRPERSGRYQDLYLFAYGDDYARALRDLRTLTGTAPLLPRKAFGVWYSKYWPYGESDWRELVERFREERVPLDTISLDTDFKRVHDRTAATIGAALAGADGGDDYSWNGWDWNAELYPDPERFFRWAHDNGLETGLNVHPSISSTDPRFPETQERAGGGLTADGSCLVLQADPHGDCMVFDWADPKQLDAYFALHERFERDGADFWWLDWCCDGSRADDEGLTPDTWINKQYADRQRARGSRWPAFSRIGGSFQAGPGGREGSGAFAEHRHTIQFTGDTCATWPLLRFASEFTAAAASIGMPYVSHDIGTFHGESPIGLCERMATPFVAQHTNSLPEDMYVRWVQLGTFQPLDRLHSNHGQRLPWEYTERPETIAAEFLRLRGALVPYLYTLARRSHDTGLPMAGPMWLRWPSVPEAYEHPSQYLLGRDVLVAPVSAPGDPAEATVWFPPGVWVDWFTGERFRGPATERMTVPLDRMPVFVRAGAIIPTQPAVPTTPAGPLRSVVLTAYRGDGRFVLYDDAGEGFGYERGEFTRTAIIQRHAGGVTTVRIRRARGAFPGQPGTRRYLLRVVGVARPRVVIAGGRRTRRWSYDRSARILSVRLGRVPARRGVRLRFG